MSSPVRGALAGRARDDGASCEKTAQLPAKIVTSIIPLAPQVELRLVAKDLMRGEWAAAGVSHATGLEANRVAL